MGSDELRWKLADNDPQGALFADDELVDRHFGRGEFAGLEFLHVKARRVINEVPKRSNMPFRFTINAYRGCSHACVYCFARPTHDYLGMNIGEDFDRRIVVKINAVERVRAELASPKWGGERVAMGTNTDPYQRCEGKYHLTQGIIGALTEAANPFSILTKSTLILRDLDLLTQASRRTDVSLAFSIGTLDEHVWRLAEPGTPHPRRRVEAVAKLVDAGLQCSVLVAPILPGLSDRPEQVREVVEACVEAGATSISGIPLHLRGAVRGHYLQWLEGVRPGLVAEHEQRYAKAYLPRAEREAVSALIGDARREAEARRGRPAVRRPQPPRRASRPKPAPAPASEVKVAEQLALGL